MIVLLMLVSVVSMLSLRLNILIFSPHMSQASWLLPVPFLKISSLCHPDEFSLVFLWFFFPLVVLPLYTLTSNPPPSVSHVQTVLTVLFLIFLLYGIVPVHVYFFYFLLSRLVFQTIILFISTAVTGRLWSRDLTVNWWLFKDIITIWWNLILLPLAGQFSPPYNIDELKVCEYNLG